MSDATAQRSELGRLADRPCPVTELRLLEYDPLKLNAVP